MTTDEATQRLREARSRLWRTLAGDGVKLNNSPDEHETEVEYRDISEIIKLNQSKAQLRSTLSSGRIKQAAAPNIATETATWASAKTGNQIVSIVPQDAVQELNEAKVEMQRTIAYAFTKSNARDDLVDTMQKQNQCPLDNLTGKFNVTQDSPITPSGTPFSGGWEITGRGGRVTLSSIAAEEQEAADEDSPSPAVVSGQDGTADWSPREHQDGFDSEDDEEIDPEQESADILQMYTSANGRVSKYAKAHFLTVTGDGTSSSQYAIPLSRMNKLSNQPKYFDKFLAETFSIAAGRDSGLANYGKMSRVVRIKQRNNMSLTAEQKDHVVRHMAAVPPTAEEYNDAATGRTQ